MTEIQQIKALLSSPKDVVILSHRNPDGDAIGSSLALQFFLKKLMHSVTIVLPSECPPMFDFLEGMNEIVIYDLDALAVKNAISKAKILFFLDFNSLERIDKLGEFVLESSADSIMIDHHIDPEPIADFIISDVEASSTSELIYKFIDDLGFNSKIDSRIGTSIFTGIVTDTGSFKYNTRSYTYNVCGALKEVGINDYYLQDKIFNSLKEKHLRLLGHCLANRMEVDAENGTAMIYLTKADYRDYSISRGDTEGIVNYMLMMKEVDVAAFITEQPSIIKLSLRSKGDINVQNIASTYFNGGGHKNASGGSFSGKLEDILNKWREIAPTINKNK
jgi:bifunctional oligoribonuclease and PAP phosphatase NrnA